MKFSIIIPVYNAEHFIEHCVESILNQTYKNIEVLLIDDGSTDNSREVCYQIKEADSRVKVIHQDNTGAAGARNNGIKHASGDYLLFPDSDDYYLIREGLQEIADLLEKSQADILFFDHIIYKGGDFGDLSSDLTKEEVDKSENVLNILIKRDKLTRSAWTKVVKRQLIIDNQISFPDVRQTEDTGFTADLLRVAETFDWYDKKFYAYVKHPNSITAKRLTKQTIDYSFYVLTEAIKKRESITDSARLLSYDSYLAYPYIVLLGQVKEAMNRGELVSDDILVKLKDYSFLIKAGLNPRTVPIRLMCNVLGYNMTVLILGFIMDQTYKKQGV
ncbi:glycosyltransferase [Lactococcus garvieae]|jgi:glycosyltransferase involved in cell wall biosynthesis|uniref:Glycosyltransferase family 2 protein n=1 Tax=Lactococcus garvieae TaxID=1363 RepID=A0AAX3NB27_9LACT|nr:MULTISPECIES: glycosyltransferase family 2 protein [Lactococcus]NHI68687.1 glycosyltransferase [Lactococcus garvieae]NHJ06848.1 glycosyltransferase [Lactococcus garvieae]WEA13827.1 glycosyltransferase family 2 protein [Lactococcus garvieae]